MSDTQLVSLRKTLESACLQIDAFKKAVVNDESTDDKTKKSVCGLLDELQSRCQSAKVYSATKHPFLRRKRSSSSIYKNAVDITEHAPKSGKHQSLGALDQLLKRLGKHDPSNLSLIMQLGAMLAPLFWPIMFQLTTQLNAALENPGLRDKQYTIGKVEKTSFESLDPQA
jgi:hypothetical protein